MTTDSQDIRTEADDILRSGLLSILGRHGEVHIVGRYVLGLRTRRMEQLIDDVASEVTTKLTFASSASDNAFSNCPHQASMIAKFAWMNASLGASWIALRHSASPVRQSYSRPIATCASSWCPSASCAFS
jgi:hypothetical protein